VIGIGHPQTSGSPAIDFSILSSTMIPSWRTWIHSGSVAVNEKWAAAIKSSAPVYMADWLLNSYSVKCAYLAHTIASEGVAMCVCAILLANL
jgi:hypothetical protein